MICVHTSSHVACGTPTAATLPGRPCRFRSPRAGELLGQVSPPAAGVEHEQDPLERGAVVDPWPPTRPPRRRPRREQLVGSTASATASAGRSSSGSCASYEPDSRPGGCMWCATTSPRTAQQVIDWCADHDVELVFTPSNASWLNWIECEFTALRYFTLDGSDYPSHAARRRRSPATSAGPTSAPVPSSASPSTLRPDYLPNVA
jgi:hypothetical protein